MRQRGLNESESQYSGKEKVLEHVTSFLVDGRCLPVFQCVLHYTPRRAVCQDPSCKSLRYVVLLFQALSSYVLKNE